MPRLTPVHWKILECIFQMDEYVFIRQKGDHKIYVKKGTPRPIVIPTYRELDTEIIKSNMRTANMDRDKYFRFLSECK